MPNTKPVGVAYSDPELSGATIDNTPIGATTPSTVEGTTVYADVEIGYAAVAQGAVTQLTNKSTAVTLNKSMGRITMNNASLATATIATFTLNNSIISENDTVILTISGGQATPGSYNVFANALATGTVSITLRNISGGSLSEAVIINFCVIHGAS
jgi:predicted ThiF/HesA family dinucleotide-utilizing enzyme